MKGKASVGLGILTIVAAGGLAGVWRLSAAPPVPAVVERAKCLEDVDRLLATGDRPGAVRAWTSAWTTALGSRRWEPLLDVGDAALRVGEDGDPVPITRANARQAYRAALLRARAQRSVDGVLRAAERFAVLGDRDVADGAVHTARRLAAGSHSTELQARVEVDAQRIARLAVDEGDTPREASGQTGPGRP